MRSKPGNDPAVGWVAYSCGLVTMPPPFVLVDLSAVAAWLDADPTPAQTIGTAVVPFARPRPGFPVSRRKACG
jgi:hypothetical protein